MLRTYLIVNKHRLTKAVNVGKTTQHIESMQMKTVVKYIFVYILVICCATNRKVAGSIPAGVIEIFH
jgi:hypothetical protein